MYELLNPRKKNHWLVNFIIFRIDHTVIILYIFFQYLGQYGGSNYGSESGGSNYGGSNYGDSGDSGYGGYGGSDNGGYDYYDQQWKTYIWLLVMMMVMVATKREKAAWSLLFLNDNDPVIKTKFLNI